MDIYLTGIIEDGGDSPSSLPENPRQAMRLLQGADINITLSIFKRSGPRLDLTTGSPVLTVTVYDRCSRQVFQKTLTIDASLGAGRARFALVPADTRNLQPGRYRYTVSLNQGGKVDFPIPLSPLLLEQTS